ncbi:hypothetical protein [Sphingobacterium mizutaii]|nr:hypothetical protein [Sphingobacterium mizutaii]
MVINTVIEVFNVDVPVLIPKILLDITDYSSKVAGIFSFIH